jgi:hypothetical protein
MLFLPLPNILFHFIHLTMRGKRLPQEIVQLIYGRHDQGMPQRAIADDLNISQKAVFLALRRRVSGQQQPIPLGRPRATTNKTDRTIALTIKRHRFSSYRQIAAHFHVSKDTIRRRGMAAGLYSRRPHRDYLTDLHKRRRRQWCLQHLTTDFQNWIFSDESVFELSDCSTVKQSFVQRCKQERYAKCCILQNPISSRRKWMVWGCITATGPGPLVFVEGHIDAQKYIALLRGHLIPFMDSIPLSRRFHTLFHQDNTPPHRAQSTLKYLQSEDIRVPVWPALSPDINPIEHVWALMKKQVRKQNPTNMNMLRTAIVDAWKNTVTTTLFNRLYTSLHSRIKHIICHKGLRSH